MRQPLVDILNSVVGIVALMVGAFFAYFAISALLRGSVSLSSSVQVFSEDSPMRFWWYIFANCLLVAFSLLIGGRLLQPLAEKLGMSRHTSESAVQGETKTGLPNRNPFACPVVRAVLTNKSLLFPDIAGEVVIKAEGGIDDPADLHGNVSRSSYRRAFEELRKRTIVNSRSLRRPVLLLQIVSDEGGQISDEKILAVTSGATIAGFSRIVELRDIGRALTDEEFSRMARRLS